MSEDPNTLLLSPFFGQTYLERNYTSGRRQMKWSYVSRFDIFNNIRFHNMRIMRILASGTWIIDDQSHMHVFSWFVCLFIPGFSYTNGWNFNYVNAKERKSRTKEYLTDEKSHAHRVNVKVLDPVKVTSRKRGLHASQ